MRIYIADDEIPIVQWIKFCIERSGQNLQIAGSASNGEDAYQGIINSNADIAILDIMMPRTNGLELLVKLKEYNPEISVFMLTNFSDFKYIQQALRLGADEYYLKSEITEEILMNTLKTMVERRLSKPGNTSLNSDYSIVSRLCTETVNQIIPGKADFEKALKHQKTLETFRNNLFVIALKLKNSENPYSNATVIGADIPFVTAMYHVSCKNDLSLLVCEMKNISSRLTIYKNMSEILRWININMPFYYGGISNIYYSINDMFDSINEAVNAMNYGFYGKAASIVYIWDVREKPIDFSVLRKYESDIFSSVKAGKYENAAEVTGHAFSYFKEITPKNINVVYDYFSGIFHNISSQVLQTDAKPQSDYLKVRKHMIDSINSCISFSRLERVIINDLLPSFAESLKNGRYSSVINEAVQYIHAHYSEQITLQSVAGHFHLNADHFGKLFKKEVKTGFTTFLTDVRMQQAEELLRTTNMKKYEIAEKIGYTNFSYFSRIYSKYKSGNNS